MFLKLRGYVLKWILENISFWGILNILKSNLHKFWCSLPALSNEIRNYLSIVYLGNSSNWKSPVDLFTYHHDNLASIHFTRCWNKRNWYLQYASCIYLEFVFSMRHYSKNSFFRFIYQLYTDYNLIFKRISVFDRIWMFLLYSIIDRIGAKGNRHLPWARNLVFPLPNIFGYK